MKGVRVVLQVAILLIVAAGVALGIYLWTQFVAQDGPITEDLLLAHMVIGLIIFAFLLIQASAALFARPAPKSQYRRAHISKSGGLTVCGPGFFAHVPW